MPGKNARIAKKVAAVKTVATVKAVEPVLTAAEQLQAWCAPGTDYWRMMKGEVSWADVMDMDDERRVANDPVYAAKVAAETAAWAESYRAHQASADARAAAAAADAAAEAAAVGKARGQLHAMTYGDVRAFADAQVPDSGLWYAAQAELQNRHWAFEEEELARHVCTCPNPDGADAVWDPPMGWECTCFKPLHRDASGAVEECRFFNSPMGCRMGTACPYTHVKRDISEIACRFEVSGVGCRPARGKTCPYKHSVGTVAPDWRAGGHSHDDDNVSVASGGSWRTAGAGGGGAAASVASEDGWTPVVAVRRQTTGPAARPPLHGAGRTWRK